jgi:hypothetical protein
MDHNRTEESAVMNTHAASARVSATESVTDAAIRAVEGPFRRFAWYLRTSGVVERTSVRIAAAAVFLAALGSIVWLATSLTVAL